MSSILRTIRKMVLGLPINSEDTDEEVAFDTDLIVHINSTFSTLEQLGAGPKDGFMITGVDETWEDFIGDAGIKVEMIKGYVYAKVKLIFDPPQNSSATEQLDKAAKEYEWRICEKYAAMK